MNFRIGFGYDVHQLEKGLDFWLGGIRIEHEKGAKGHSDADVLIHAIADALLGAAALRDIGYHFPDTDPSLKGIDSKIILKKVAEMLEKEGYGIGNIDATVCLEKPKINPHIAAMQECLAEVLSISPGQVSIKATTKEKMGFVGKQKGIEAHAVVLIHSS